MAEIKFQPANEPPADQPPIHDLNALLQKARNPQEAEDIKKLISEREKNIAAQRAQQRSKDAQRLAELVNDVLGGEDASAIQGSPESAEQPAPEHDDSADARIFKIKGRDSAGLPILEEVGMGAAQAKKQEPQKRLFRDLEERGMKITGAQDTPGGLRTVFDKSADQALQEKHGTPFISRTQQGVEVTPGGIQKESVGAIRMEGDEAEKRLRDEQKKADAGTE